MGNPKFTTMDAAMAQRHVRIALANDGLSVSQSYEICAEVLERPFQVKQTDGHHVDYMNRLVPTKGAIIGLDENGKPIIYGQMPEAPIPVRVPCTTHREKSFTFKDGTTWRACTADDCLWGRPTEKGFRKTHSDGLPVAIPEVETEEVEEVSADDPQELLPPAPERIAGAGEAEDLPDEEESMMEAAAEVAAEEEDEEEDDFE